MFFEEIIGHAPQKLMVTVAAQQQKIPHALLISGRPGVGALPFALALAQYIQCTNRKHNDSCGACPSCKKHKTYAHPDLHFVFPFKKVSKTREVCDDLVIDFRQFIQQQPYGTLSDWLLSLREGGGKGMIYANEGEEIIRKFNLKSYESDWKIMIIWLPETMSIECANKILKVLEEPPANNYFILASEQPDLLLATIISRVQTIALKGLDAEVIERQLIEKEQCSPIRAQEVARMACGSFGAAKKIINEYDTSSKNLNLFIQIMRCAYTVANRKQTDNPLLKYESLKMMYGYVDDLVKLGKDDQTQFLELFQRLVRENFIANLSTPHLNYMTAQEKDFSEKFSRFITESNVQQFIDEFSLAQDQLAQNSSAKFVFTDLMLRTIVLLKQ